MAHPQIPLSSHEFIDFGDFNAAKVKPMTWLLLGEAYSKCAHLTRAPIAPGLSEHMMHVALVSGIQATVAIEGNTLTEEQVGKVVDSGSAGVPPSQEYQEQQVRNILAAIEEIRAALVQGHRIPITAERLCSLNAKVLDSVTEADEVPGELRQPGMNVRVGNSYRPPDGREVAELVKLFEDWLRRMRSVVTERSTRRERFVMATLSAVMAHLYIAWIHPFGNGNGRVARLIETQVLAESGVVPIVSTQLMSNHFNATRPKYYAALQKAQKDPHTFVEYALTGFVEQLTEQIAQLQEQNRGLAWRDVLREIFDGLPHTEARKRQRMLAICILPGEVVTAESAPNLDHNLTRMYVKVGERAPGRDLAELVKLGVAERVGRHGFRVRRDEIIVGFVPPVSE